MQHRPMPVLMEHLTYTIMQHIFSAIGHPHVPTKTYYN